MGKMPKRKKTPRKGMPPRKALPKGRMPPRKTKLGQATSITPLKPKSKKGKKVFF